MIRFHSRRRRLHLALTVLVTGVVVLQGCKGWGRQRVGYDYEACKEGPSDPPAHYLEKNHEKDFVGYVRDQSKVHFLDDNPHLYTQVAVVSPGPDDHTYLGVASIKPEHCSHKLSDFSRGKVVSKITSTADYVFPNTHPHFLAGENYVVVYNDGGKWSIKVVHVGGTDTSPILTTVDTMPIGDPPKPTGYVVPAATFRYDLVASAVPSTKSYTLNLVDNSQCGDQCCGFTGGGVLRHDHDERTSTGSSGTTTIRRPDSANTGRSTSARGVPR